MGRLVAEKKNYYMPTKCWTPGVPPRIKDLSSWHSMETPNPGCPPGPNTGVVVKGKRQELGLLPKDLFGKFKI